MKAVLPLFTIAYGAVALLFAIAALVLMGFAFLELWEAVMPSGSQDLAGRAATAIESIGLLAVALATSAALLPASAVEMPPGGYPSWEDVQKAQQTERDVAVVNDADDVDVRLDREKGVQRTARLGAVVTQDDADPPMRRDRRAACTHRRVLYSVARRAHSPTFVGYNNW